MGTISVDPEALRIAAARLEAAADTLQTALRTHLGCLHVDAELLKAGIGHWERATRDLAVAIRGAASRFEQSEADRTRALR